MLVWRARAMPSAPSGTSSVITEPAGVAAREAVAIRCEAPDDELLLVDWLNALIYEMATRGLLFGRFQVTLTDGALDGTAWGERADVARHRPAVEIKGATYTALRVARENGEWIAQCIVDV